VSNPTLLSIASSEIFEEIIGFSEATFLNKKDNLQFKQKPKQSTISSAQSSSSSSLEDNSSTFPDASNEHISQGKQVIPSASSVESSIVDVTGAAKDEQVRSSSDAGGGTLHEPKSPAKSMSWDIERDSFVLPDRPEASDLVTASVLLDTRRIFWSTGAQGGTGLGKHEGSLDGEINPKGAASKGASGPSSQETPLKPADILFVQPGGDIQSTVSITPSQSASQVKNCQQNIEQVVVTSKYFVAPMPELKELKNSCPKPTHAQNIPQLLSGPPRSLEREAIQPPPDVNEQADAPSPRIAISPLSHLFPDIGDKDSLMDDILDLDLREYRSCTPVGFPTCLPCLWFDSNGDRDDLCLSPSVEYRDSDWYSDTGGPLGLQYEGLSLGSEGLG
jgi:hypothetical protein